MTENIREGVFFATPEALPRGRHELSREEVLLRQRERLMIAVCELMASTGYRAVGIREIAARAKVSRTAFYECFADKDACVFSAYDRFIDVLVTRVLSVLDGAATWETTVSGVVETYLGTLAADLTVARAFQVEMDALGRPAREQRRNALTGVAHVLKQRRDELWPGTEVVPLSTYVSAVYAVRQLASDLLDDTPTPELAALATEAGPWLARMLTNNAANPAEPTR